MGFRKTIDRPRALLGMLATRGQSFINISNIYDAYFFLVRFIFIFKTCSAP